MEKVGERICLDTDFLVNFLRNESGEAAFVKGNEAENELGTTLINMFELYHGAFKSRDAEKNVNIVSQLAQRLRILNLSEESVMKAGRICADLEKKGISIDFRDLFIGTIALEHGFSIKTGNAKHFSRIRGLKLL